MLQNLIPTSKNVFPPAPRFPGLESLSFQSLGSTSGAPGVHTGHLGLPNGTLGMKTVEVGRQNVDFGSQNAANLFQMVVHMRTFADAGTIEKYS